MIKTVSLTAGTELAVELVDGCHCCIENRGSGVIYASKTSGIIADSDGVTAIDSGSSKVLRNIAQYKKDDNSSYDYYGKIYLLSDTDTKAEIQTANDLSFKLKNSAKGGGTYDDSAIKADISNLQAGKADKSDVYTKLETDNKITSKVAEIVADAPEDFDTLKEMSDWIASHENDASAMNSAIQTNSSAITALQSGKVDKVEGMGLSSNDYTKAEKNKLAGIEANANKTLVDSALSSTSTNAVQNKIVKAGLDKKLDVTGVANSATKLQTSRKINGISFNGTSDITVPLTAGKVYNNSANKWGKVVDIELISKNRIYTVYLMVSAMNMATSGYDGYLRFVVRYNTDGAYYTYLTWIWCGSNVNVNNFKAVSYQTENGVMFELWIKNGDSSYKGVAVTPIEELTGFGNMGNGAFRYYEVENNTYDSLPDYATEANTVTSSTITLAGKIQQAENDSNGSNIASKFENLEQQINEILSRLDSAGI